MKLKEIVKMWWESHIDTFKQWREPVFWFSIAIGALIIYLINR